MPLLRILSNEEIDAVHTASLEVLKRVGCSIQDGEFLGQLASVGAEVDINSRTAKVPESIVEESLKKAGKTCRLYGRNPKFDVTLAHGRILGHQSEGATYVLDLETGMHRLSSMNDVELFARLSQGLENVNIAMCPVVPQDSPIQTRGIDAARILLENTSKPCSIAGLAKGVERYVRKMGEFVAGGPDEFRKRPIMDNVLLAAISPLQFGAEELRAFRESVKQGASVSVASMPQAGGTAPVTLAGALVIQIAEILMSITLGQLIVPGLAMYVLIRAGIVDPRSGIFSSGAAESGLVQAAAVQVCMERYGLCVDGGWAASDSKLLDEQTGYEKTFGWLQSGLAGASMVSGMGAIESGMTQSPAQLVVDDEIVKMVNRIAQGVQVDRERLAVDAIEKVGIGGNFLGAKHTLNHLTGELWLTRLADRNPRKAWERNGSRELIEKGRETARKLLESCEIEPLAPDVKKSLDEVVGRGKKEIYSMTS